MTSTSAVIVTGAAGDMGRALARRFAADRRQKPPLTLSDRSFYRSQVTLDEPVFTVAGGSGCAMLIALQCGIEAVPRGRFGFVC